MTPRSSTALYLTSAMLLLGSAVQAQSTPGGGELLREIERSQPKPVPAVPPAAAAPKAPSDAGQGERIRVKAFRLQGTSLVPEADLQAELAGWIDRDATFADLRRAADVIAEAYRSRGLLARAYLPDQDIQGGIVTIAVLEGRLAELRIEMAPGSSHLGAARAAALMSARQQLGAPVRPDDVQRAITLLNDLPGVSATSLLEPGNKDGESRLVVAVKDGPAGSGLIQVDNTGSRASGENRLTLSGSLNSPLGLGDQLQGLANVSRGSRYARLGYSLPVGNDGLRGGVAASVLDYSYSLTGTRYTGSAGVFGVTLSYPWLRTQSANLQLGLGLDAKDFVNEVGGIPLSDKTLNVANLSLSGDRADDWFGGGLFQFNLGLSLGRLDLSGNAGDLAGDQSGPNRQGDYDKLGWSLSRQQRVSVSDSVSINASGQLASRNLDSAEKFQATGPYGVRAYSASEPAGDSGQLLSLEWRHAVDESLSLSAFHDRAWIRRDRRETAASLPPNRYALAGSGVALSWGTASQLLVRASLAWRQGSNPARNVGTGDDADGGKRNPRLFLTLLHSF